jgi:hypothetical protein
MPSSIHLATFLADVSTIAAISPVVNSCFRFLLRGNIVVLL